MTQAVDLLFQACFMAVVALGAWVAMGDGMALAWLGRFVARMGLGALAMPLATCPRCMVSVWGLGTLLLSGTGIGVGIADGGLWLDPERLAQLPVLILAACGIQEILHRP